MDLDALEDLLKSGRVGTVVVTAGTTGLGAIDPIDQALPLCRSYGARVHVDAAYGGFFTLIADDTAEGVARAPYAAIAESDSVVIDPHKHGLQPYGCGAVIFRDPGVATHYLHDSPYTYFTSDELHLGEISIECSRAGAAAAALWLTFQLLPPTEAGLGQVLRPGRRAALAWSELIKDSDAARSLPTARAGHRQLLPGRTGPFRDRPAVRRRCSTPGWLHPPPRRSSSRPTPSSGERWPSRGHKIKPDVDAGRILRSVLMKPESELIIPQLHAGIEALITGESATG